MFLQNVSIWLYKVTKFPYIFHSFFFTEDSHFLLHARNLDSPQRPSIHYRVSNAHCSALKLSVSQHMKWSGNKSRQIRILLTIAFSLFNFMKKYPSHFIHTSQNYLLPPSVSSQVKNFTFLETFCSCLKTFTYILILCIAINDPSFMIFPYSSS